MIAAAVRRHVAALRRRLRRDDGMTLIELTVGMVLMSIFMAMFTGAILMINRSLNTSQAINDAASQVNTAFLRLDETARSATYISAPGTTTSGSYVEMRSLDSSGKDMCTQLRVATASQQLQSRTWRVVNNVATTPSAWLPIASGITNGAVTTGTTIPFVRTTTSGANLFQQLTVTLMPTAGAGISTSSAASSFTVTALNSTAGAPTSTVCQLTRP